MEKKLTKKSFNDFISKSMNLFGFGTKKEYLEERAKKNYVVMEKVGEDENGNGKFQPLQWEDGSYVVLNTKALAEEEAKEYEGAVVITEYEMYELYKVAA